MNAVQALQEVSGLSMLARDYLVIARVAAQEAVVVREAWNNVLTDAAIRREATSLRQKARQYRRYAKEVLVEAEEINGRLYCNGEDWLPLREGLNGRNFREWPIYKGTYARSHLFRGVDPN